MISALPLHASPSNPPLHRIHIAEILTVIIGHLDAPELSVCLRVSQTWFDIAGDYLYRVLVVDLQRTHHCLEGLHKRPRIWRDGDVLPEGKNLKRILVEKCRDITILPHFVEHCRFFAKIETLSIPVIRYLQDTSYDDDRVPWLDPHRICDRSKLENDTYDPHAKCPFIDKLERPKSVIVNYPRKAPNSGWDPLEGPLHQTTNETPSASVNYTAILPGAMAFPVSGEEFQLGLSDIQHQENTNWTLVFWADPSQSWFPSPAELDLSDNLEMRPGWISEFCHTIAVFYVMFMHPRQSVSAGKSTITLTLCNLDSLHPEGGLMQILCPDRERNRAEFQQLLKETMAREIENVEEEQGEQDYILKTPITYCSIEEFIASGNWEDALTSEQATPWLDRIQKRMDKKQRKFERRKTEANRE